MRIRLLSALLASTLLAGAAVPATAQTASGRRKGLTITPAVASTMMLQVRAASCGVVGKSFPEVTAVSAIETCAAHRTDALSNIAFLRIRDRASTE